jgi:hypothetical protein
MGWVVVEQDRWTRDDDTVRHLLLKTGTTYTELQDVTVHTYVGAAEVVDLAWPLTEDTVYQHTVIREELAEVSDDDIWEAITP